MYSQENIHKIRRLSNTIEIKSRRTTIDPDRFAKTVKLPALNAINKSVKYGDVSFTLDRGLNKLRKEPESTDSLGEDLAHNSLMAIRKKYDKINKERQTQESLIHELEIEKDKFRAQNIKFQHQKAEGENKVKRLEQEMKNIKFRCEQAQMQRKVVSNMTQRLKSDKIVFDQRKYAMQHSLNLIGKQRQVIVKEGSSMKQSQENTRRIYQKMVEHIQEQQQQRQIHLGSIQNMINQKITVHNTNQGRQNEMVQIAENTLSEKDSNQKKWYKVYLCQKFVHKLLRDKIGREMKKFGIVEAAFKNIKTQTGVNTTEQLVKKFLHKEGDYGILLGTIADKEKQISQLKAENQEMSRQRSKLRTQSNAFSFNKRQQIDVTKEEKDLHLIDEKSTNCDLYLEKLATWLGKVQKKISVFKNEKAAVEQIQHNNQQISTHFATYLKDLLNELQNEQVVVQKDKFFDSVSNYNNLRIKIEAQPERNEKQKQTTEFDEGQYVNNLRSQMIRNNEKHMKELKKKYEEAKRQKMEAQPKKKDVSPDKSKLAATSAQHS